MKKLILLIILMGITMEAGAMSMFGKSEGFRFEDYKKADNAKEALLKMHPIGSNVDGLVKTLTS